MLQTRISSEPAELERLLNSGLERILGEPTKLFTVTSPASNQIEISANISDLETVLTQLAKREADKRGVEVEEVRLNFCEIDQRALDVEADVRAKKMFFATTIRITGRLAIDGQLKATISNLTCTGEGTIGSMACGFLSPQLVRLEGRGFPLTGLLASELSLRDVRLSAGERLSVAVEFAT